jgi:hypothetical protein
MHSKLFIFSCFVAFITFLQPLSSDEVFSKMKPDQICVAYKTPLRYEFMLPSKLNKNEVPMNKIWKAEI